MALTHWHGLCGVWCFMCLSGKTALVKLLASVLNRPLQRINLSQNITLETLIGSYVPRIDPTSQQRLFRWEDGALVRALKAKEWILFDEINLAPPENTQPRKMSRPRQNVPTPYFCSILPDVLQES